MEHQQRSIDREMGELIGAFNTFTENNKRQFNELKNDMEKLSSQFSDYKADHDNQTEKDYTYLDKKIGEVDKRVSDLERIEDAYQVAKKAKIETPASKFFQKIMDSGATLAAGAVVAFFVYLVLLWLKSSSAI